jgi:exodeoxyribonuclease X
MTVRVIDIETTGTDPAVDAVIEIASVDVQKDGTITNHLEQLVCPPIPVPPEASAVHHLLYQDLTGKPPLREVLPFFQGAQAYVAHNAEFERAFLGAHLGEALWVCTYKCALRVWPDFPEHSNQALRYRLGLANPFGIDRRTLNPHRALSDAIVTAAIFVELTKRVTWPDLVRWSAEPALHTRLPMGKHRGERFDAVSEDYLRWIIDGRNELREEIKASAAYWLEKRGANASHASPIASA